MQINVRNWNFKNHTKFWSILLLMVAKKWDYHTRISLSLWCLYYNQTRAKQDQHKILTNKLNPVLSKWQRHCRQIQYTKEANMGWRNQRFGHIITLMVPRFDYKPNEDIKGTPRSGDQCTIMLLFRRGHGDSTNNV